MRAKKALPPKTKRPVGHPPIYTPELAAEVCRRIARGEALEAIEKVDGMPSADCVHGWVVDDTHGFYGDYLRARRMQALTHLDECKRIADESGLDVRFDEATGKVVVDGEVVRRAELRIKTRQWGMERVYEKVFGTKLKVEDVTPKRTAAELDDEIAAKLAARPELLVFVKAMGPK